MIGVNYGVTEASFGVNYNAPELGAAVYGVPVLLSGIWAGASFLPFGKVIVGDRDDVRLPSADTDVFLGVVAFTKTISTRNFVNYDPATGRRGYDNSETIAFTRNGNIYVFCRAPATAGERAAFLFTGPDAGDIVPESAATPTTAIVIPSTRILTSLALPGIVGVEFNLP